MQFFNDYELIINDMEFQKNERRRVSFLTGNFFITNSKCVCMPLFQQPNQLYFFQMVITLFLMDSGKLFSLKMLIIKSPILVS